MSQLIQMRQRMKAVETIKKITHAMRLISMSAHTRLRSKKEALAYYKSEVLQLLGAIQPQFPQWHHKKLFAKKSKTTPPLFILVGSQKGLCGTFNVSLFSYFEKNFHPKQNNAHIITVGKKASDYMQEQQNSVVMRFSEFSSVTLSGIVDQIIEYILRPTSDYSQVVIVSNYAKNFFIQYPTTTQLIPFAIPKTTSTWEFSETYMWEQSPNTILTNIAETLLQITLYDTLLESLVAEQAARFIAMDNSTRNASNLLDTMHLEYNKTRQAKITRELTDLVSSFQ